MAGPQAPDPNAPDGDHLDAPGTSYSLEADQAPSRPGWKDVGAVVIGALGAVASVATLIVTVTSQPLSNAETASSTVVFALGCIVSITFLGPRVRHWKRLRTTLTGLIASGVLTGLFLGLLQNLHAEPVAQHPGATSARSSASVSPVDLPSPPITTPTTATPSPTPQATSISSATASEFFIQYYFPEALRDPREALEMLGTEDFKKQKEVSGVDSYVKFYRDTRVIPSDQVGVVRHNNLPDTFSVRFIRVPWSGQSERVETIYTVRCLDASSTNPFGCPSKDLRIEKSDRLN